MNEAPTILAGRYELGGTIGRGGMAEVHIGYDRRLGRSVAVKVLRSDLARDPSFLNRFRREAQAAASLNHPAVVAVYDTGEESVTASTGAVSVVPFIVMEYVEGHTVRDVLQDGPLPLPEALEITAGVLSALEYSHNAGIVHRDIKPANVMLTPTGSVKVMDFGIARAMADSAATMTQTQAVIGTAQYLSPEQARGETVDARSDLYSTGCLLFELLTGRPPFMADSMVAVAYQHVREIPPSPSTLNPQLPEVVDRIVHKALAKDRQHRYQSAAEFRADLEALVRGGRVQAPAVGMASAQQAVTQVMSPQGAATQLMMPPPAQAPWQSTGAPVHEEPKPAEKSSPKRGILIGLVVLAVILIGIITVILVNRSGTETVAVPDVVGMTEAEALTKLEEAQLDPVVAYVQDQAEKGTVFKTDPEAGATVNLNFTVTYYISTGPADGTIPDVSGKTAAEAQALLEEAGYTVNGDRENDDSPDFEKGEVTKTDPEAGSPGTPGDTTITLYVATGNVMLEDVVGMTQQEATDTLDALSFNVIVKEKVDTEAEAGTVLLMSPEPNSLLRQGAAVTITVSTRPEQAEIPDDLPGTEYDVAYGILRDLGFTNIQRVDMNSDTFAEGDVISVTPVGGTPTDLNAPITLRVSLGSSPTGDPSD